MMFLQKPAARILAERKAGFVLRALSVAGAAILLAACSEPLKPPPDAERVRIVLYHPLQSGDAMKTVGDWAMLKTGELVQIKTNGWLASMGIAGSALPVPTHLVEPDDVKWFESSDRQIGKGEIEALLDRKYGLLCVVAKCQRVYAICPPRERAMKHGLKCETYSVN